MPSILICCGEASGDLYAGALTAEIGKLRGDVSVHGFGGERLRAAGAELLGEYRGLAVTGLLEAGAVLRRSLAVYRMLVESVRTHRPDVFVAIDFPEINLRVAEAVHRLGIPVVFYVSPQIWAWRPARIAKIKRLAKKMLVIFPFEEALYREAGVPVEFVGHPLVDLVGATRPRETFLGDVGLDSANQTVALLPGSRTNEVSSILPVLLEAVPLIRRDVPAVQFVVARAPNLDADLFRDVSNYPRVVTVEGNTDEALAAADLVVTASGTATVQAALHECPMVIVYRLSRLTYLLGKPFVKVDMYGMANLVAGSRIVPELIQRDFTAENVAARAVPLLTDTARAEVMRAALRGVKAKLGAPGASRRAAEAVLKEIRS